MNRASVNETTIREDLTSLALTVTVTRPYYSLMQLGKGLNAYPDLLQGIEEGVILQLFESQIPSHQALLAEVKPMHSADLRFQEESLHALAGINKVP